MRVTPVQTILKYNGVACIGVCLWTGFMRAAKNYIRRGKGEDRTHARGVSARDFTMPTTPLARPEDFRA